MVAEIIDYHKYLAKIIECEVKQDPSIQHEFTFSSANEAVKVANYLRNLGYKAIYKSYKVLSLDVFYVGVPFSTLKKSNNEEK